MKGMMVLVAAAIAMAASADAVERRCELQGEPFTCVGLAGRQAACNMVDMHEELIEMYSEMGKPGAIYDDIPARAVGNALGIGFHDARQEVDQEYDYIVQWMEDLLSIFHDGGPAAGMAAITDLCDGRGG